MKLRLEPHDTVNARADGYAVFTVRHHFLPDAVAIIGTMDLVFGEVDR